jgi:hypothetical protein
MIPDRKKYIDYCDPHDIDYVCFLVAKPPLKPKWMDLLLPFHSEVWYATLATLVLSMMFIFMYLSLHPNAELRPLDGAFYLVAVVFDESYTYTEKIR